VVVVVVAVVVVVVVTLLHELGFWQHSHVYNVQCTCSTTDSTD
jgi:hypothetical protein